MMKKVIFFSSLIIIVLISSCKEDNPVPADGQPQLILTLEDVSCTEAWVKLSANNISLPADVDLYKDSSLSETINLTTADTVLYVDSLLPNKSYSFHPVIQSISQSSNSLNVTTMDTTSHDFTWQTWTFGGMAGSCDLRDVAIINENDIWAVGAIYVADTSQNGYTFYNAVHWDGSQWQIKRISVIHNGSSITPPLYGIFSFSETDIWLSSGVPIHWDGANWVQYHLFDMGVLGQDDGYLTRIWGESPDNIYFVGTLGTIAHYQNGQWSRIESGTGANINDIWGVPDGNGDYIKNIAAGNSILEIDKNDNLTTINGPSGIIIISVWGKSNNLIYTAGDGIVLYKNNRWEKIDNPEVNSVYRIKGEELNEIYGISSPGNVLKYFNGYSWHTINTETENRYWRIDSRGNKIAASGYRGEAALVTIITKN